MGINRRKEALLKEREKRERAYLQGVAEERDYMSDSEVSNIREAKGGGQERPRTAPQSEFDQFIPPQTEADSQYNTLTSPYSHYGQYVPQSQTTSPYTQQNLYQQQPLYHQQVSPYTTLSLPHAQGQSSSYQHALLLQQEKQRQTTLSDLEPKNTTNYEVIHNQPLLIVPTSTDSGYGVAHLGGKYSSLDLRMGLGERSMASSPMSSISADSFYADIDHHNSRNYLLIEDIGELTKASTGLSNTGLGSGFNIPDKELSKADRLLRAAEVRRTAEVNTVMLHHPHFYLSYLLMICLYFAFKGAVTIHTRSIYLFESIAILLFYSYDPIVYHARNAAKRMAATHILNTDTTVFWPNRSRYMNRHIGSVWPHLYICQ